MSSNTNFPGIITGWIILFCLNFIPVSADISEAIFLNQQTTLVIKNNKLYISRSYELQINNRLGEEYAEINIPYSKMNKVSKIEAKVKDKNGNIVRKLKAVDIKERSSMSDDSFYDDNLVKEFTLIHNVYPYTLCFSYQLEEESFLSLDHWSPCFF